MTDSNPSNVSNRSSERPAERDGRTQKAPLLTIVFALTTSALLYQNCSPTQPADSGTGGAKSGVYSSTVSGYSGSGATAGTIGASPVAGGSGSTGATGSTGGAVPVTPIAPVSPPPGSSGSGTLPGGGTGTNAFAWSYQPEDRTLEEGEILTLSAFASKGYDPVTYQWYKNGQAISGQTSYIFRQYLVPLTAAGQYYVVAKTGTETITSQTIVVKVKPARTSCLAGYYGVYPGSNDQKTYWHESSIGRANAPYRLDAELADAYTVQMPASPTLFQNSGVDCQAGNGQFQCRNGKLVFVMGQCTQIGSGLGGA